MKYKGLAVLMAVSLTMSLLLPSTVHGKNTIMTVTYGNNASIKEGDHDFIQAVFFSVPKDIDQKLFLRVFDPDCGGKTDQRIGEFNTSTRFRLYGGTGVFSPFSGRDGLPPAAEIIKQLEKNKTTTLIHEKTFGIDKFFDNRWYTFAEFPVNRGEPVNGRYFFLLIVEGLNGNDGNIYDLFVSSSQRRNILPDGLEIFCPSTTIHIPNKETFAEIRFHTPRETEEITVHNFDAVGAGIDVRTVFRSGLKVKTSSQGEWAQSTIRLDKKETGRLNAVALKGGTELPNDASVYITGPNGKKLPIRLPVYAWKHANRRPVPGINTLVLHDCAAVVFDGGKTTDKDNDSLSYYWDFGDGQTAEGIRVSHAYKTGGVYTAGLTVTDHSGQVSNSARITEQIRVNLPPVAKAGDNMVAAPGETVSFDGSKSHDPDGTITKYIWNFGDAPAPGSSPIASGSRVTHRFLKPGLYKVRLQVTDDSGTPCQSAEDTLEVFVNAAPRIEIGKNLSGSPRQAIEFDGSNCFDSDGEIFLYSWDFGDGNKREGRIVRHAYEKPGTYNVVLTIKDDSGARNNSAQDSLKVFINDRPVARAGDYRKISAAQAIKLDGTQSYDPDGSIELFEWDLGDGTKKQGRVIDHSYAKPGKYTVQLTVRDDSRTTSDLNKDSMQIDVNFPPVARAGEDVTVTQSTVAFDGSGSSDQDDGILSYAWDFGDGGKSSAAKPVHTYAKPGTYTVSLTVTDRSRTTTGKHTDQLTVIVNEKPVAHAGKDILTAPGQAVVLDGSGSADRDGHIAGYKWDLGDGTEGIGKTFSHRYKNPGVYTVSLTVTDNTGHPEAAGFDQAVVTVNAPPVAAAGHTVSAAPGQAVTLDGSRSYDPDGFIKNYRWTFSDGKTSDKKKTVRAFDKPGIYTAVLTVTDNSAAANSTASDKIYIKINHRPQAVAPKDVFTCDPTVVFDGSQSADADGDFLHYTWDFSDGTPPAAGKTVVHTFKKGGTYPVTLTADDGSGLANARHTVSMKVTVNHPPVANPGKNKTVCAGKPVIFDGGQSSDPDLGLLKYHWDFGDKTTARGVNPVKTFKQKGVYHVVLTVKDDSGLPCAASTGSLTVTVIDSPIARAGEDQSACVSGTVQFDGSQSYDADGVVNRFEWDFGDGTTGGGAAPTHIYSAPGTYRVLLTITGDQRGGCENTDTDEVTVTVVKAPVAVIDAGDIVPAGAAVTFDGSKSTSTGSPIDSWQWDFGDGQTASGKTVTHSFQKHGKYPVTLTVQTGSQAQCAEASVKQFIIVNSPPRAAAGKELHIGLHQPFVLDARQSVDLDGAITAYNWDLGDGTKAAGMEIRHKYKKSGTYNVTLTVTDDTQIENNRHSDTIKIRVNAAPSAVIKTAERGSAGIEKKFDGISSSDPDGDNLSYHWDFGDGEHSEQAAPVHTYRRPGVYQVSLTVDDGFGLSNSKTKTTRLIIINHPPEPRTAVEKRGCTGHPVHFDASSSVDRDGKIVSYSWDFGDGSKANGPVLDHTYKKPGIYNAVLTVTDDSGTRTAAVPLKLNVVIQAPPIAKIIAKDHCYSGGVHDGILFDATQSRAHDNRPLQYAWDFGDGQTAKGPRVFHAFKKPGKYTVKLIVKDGSGTRCARGEDTVKVTVKRR